MRDHYFDQLLEPLDFRFKNGFNQLIDYMAHALPIQYNEVATQVYPLSTGEVQISTQSGKRYQAKTCLCTLPLGVLQKGDVDFAHQYLTPQREKYLQQLKMGPISKFILAFSQKFWGEDCTYLSRVDNQRRTTRTYFLETYTRTEPPHLLTSYLTGIDALRTDPMSDQEFIKAMCSDLDEMFPHAAPVSRFLLKMPNGENQYLRKKWSEDPFTRGGYSFQKFQESEEMDLRRKLASAIDSKPVFWAGEAYEYETEPSATHSAYRSGERAATQIFQYLDSAQPIMLNRSQN